MTERRPLFRPTAVEHRARARTTGRVLAWRDVRAARAFTALLALLALSVAGAALVPVEESATGTVYVGQGRGDAVVLLPIGAAARLKVGQAARVTIDREIATRVTAVEAPRTENGVTYAVARVTIPAGGAAKGKAVVVLARHPLAVALLPSLGG